jgi:hypothetical protein
MLDIICRNALSGRSVNHTEPTFQSPISIAGTRIIRATKRGAKISSPA